jgi:hypothetical protein
MGSPKTRPTVAAKWPRTAESQRRGIREAADDAREILVEIRAANDDRNPMLVAALLTMLEVRVADIQRLAVEARIGPEPEGSEL